MTDFDGEQKVPLAPLFSARASIDPSRTPAEEFDLLSIPAYDAGEPEVVAGADIGSSKLLVRPGDVLISKIVPHIQRAWVVPERGNRRQIASSEWIVLRSDAVLPEYLRYVLLEQSFHSKFLATVDGLSGSLQRARPQLVRRIQVRIPRLEQQRAIVGFLDRETATIDAFIAKNEELITLLTERRANTIRVATSVGVERNPQVVDSGVAEIGKIRAGWRMMRLSLLFGSTGSGTTPPAEFVVDFEDADFPWVTTGELREARITTTLRGISEQTLATTPALKIHPKGSLLLAMYGATIGRTAILDIDAASNQAVCALSRPRGCDVQYVEYALQASRERLMLDAVGGGQPNVNQEVVRAFRIPVPPLDEQHAIVRRIRDEVKRTDEAIDTARRSIELARERRAALISAAVTGKIDVGVSA